MALYAELLFICVLGVGVCFTDEAQDRRINDKAQAIVEREDFDLKSLPVHSQSVRNHSSCPDVTETVTEHRQGICMRLQLMFIKCPG